uniref:Mitochondrial carrier protein n=1 Tax=Lotharella globosa TaxID=91324 RepID=A0A6U3AS15_9EUKA
MEGLPSSVKQVISGSAAGISATLLVHPLDTIRTRVQTADVSGVQYRGAIDCAAKTLKYEGLQAFYKGITFPLLAQAVYKSVIFTSYHAMQSLFPQTDGPPPIPRVMLCGAAAGGINSFVVTPVELIRNNLMVQYDHKTEPRRWRNSMELVKDLTKRNGITGLWRGIGPTFLRDSIGVASWFGSFEVCLRYLCPHIGLSGTPALLLSGVSGGIGFWVAAFPLDTIKSLVQVEASSHRGSAISVLLSLVRNGELHKLFRGFGVAVMRGIPGAAITFTVQRKTREALG